MPDPIPPARPATDPSVEWLRGMVASRPSVHAVSETLQVVLARLDAAEAERDAALDALSAAQLALARGVR
jgi:hypothetical protein